MDTETNEASSLLALTADIVEAYASGNRLSADQLVNLIGAVHGSLSGLGGPVQPAKTSTEYEPAVSVRKSVASPDHLISLIDGKPYRMLKRHLAKHGLTPAEYRARYDLKPDYPMTSPAYSAARSDLAKSSGLGRKTGTKVSAAPKRGTLKLR